VARFQIIGSQVQVIKAVLDTDQLMVQTNIWQDRTGQSLRLVF